MTKTEAYLRLKFMVVGIWFRKYIHVPFMHHIGWPVKNLVRIVYIAFRLAFKYQGDDKARVIALRWHSIYEIRLKRKIRETQIEISKGYAELAKKTGIPEYRWRTYFEDK